MTSAMENGARTASFSIVKPLSRASGTRRSSQATRRFQYGSTPCPFQPSFCVDELSAFNYREGIRIKHRGEARAVRQQISR